MHSTDNIGFSKFADLCPKNFVVAGGSGTHCVYVCTYHQNIELVINDGKLKYVTFNDESKLTD